MRVLRSRHRPAAFWYLGRHRLVVGVMRRYLDEPLMSACAMTQGTMAAGVGELLPFAPGLLEAAQAVGGRELEHTAALSKDFCCLVEEGGPVPDGDPQQPWCRFSVRGVEGAAAYADAAAVDAARSLFRRCGLELRVLDCEDCALASLAQHLGSARGEAVDPLAAVELHEDCVAAATSIGFHLAVPVGLALARLGRSRFHAHG